MTTRKPAAGRVPLDWAWPRPRTRLNGHIYYTLFTAGARTLGDVTDLDVAALNRMGLGRMRLGPKSIAEIRATLHRYGLHLKGEEGVIAPAPGLLLASDYSCPCGATPEVTPGGTVRPRHRPGCRRAAQQRTGGGDPHHTAAPPWQSASWEN